MWTVAAANKRFKGSLGNYNGLTDQHLAHYFSSPVIKAHLVKTGLVTKDGTIVPESDLKVQYIQKQRLRDYQELLASAIVQKALHLEHARQAKIRQHLEDIAKIELVERIKRPHTVGAISKPCKQPVVSGSPYQYSCSSVSLKDVLETTNRAKSSDYAHRKLKTKLNRNLSRSTSSSKSRNSDYFVDFRNLGYTTSFKFQERTKGYMQNKKMGEGKCQVTLYYHGNKIFWWMNKLPDQDQEIVVKQQHCGGNPVVVFKGTKTAKENVTFTSYRHVGYPFSITIFIDGIRDLKLSACCEYRYQRGSRLGGKTGHFTFVSAEGGNPCVKCQVIDSGWLSQSPIPFLPRKSLKVSSVDSYAVPRADDIPDSVDKENFSFMKKDNSSSHSESEVAEEEVNEAIENIPNNEDGAAEISDEDEARSFKADDNNDHVSSADDGSPESIRSQSDNPASEVHEAYSEVDAGPEQCVDLEYDSDSADGDAASHRTDSSASNTTKHALPLKVNGELHAVNLDVRSMSEDEGAEEHVIIAEVHASDASDT